MHELLFRAFDKATNRMIAQDFTILGEVNCFQLIEQELMKNSIGKSTLERIGDVVIMQYTGKKDKNNTRIYQSDIVHSLHAGRAVVSWFNDGWHLKSLANRTFHNENRTTLL